MGMQNKCNINTAICSHIKGLEAAAFPTASSELAGTGKLGVTPSYNWNRYVHNQFGVMACIPLHTFEEATNWNAP